MLKGLNILLLALALAIGLAPAAPALASVDDDAAVASGCCSPPALACDRAALPDADAQTPVFSPAASIPSRERALRTPHWAAAVAAPEVRGGPPLYLRFQRFLL